MVSRKSLVKALVFVCVVSVCMTTALAQRGGRGGRGGGAAGRGGGAAGRGGAAAGRGGGGGGGLTSLLMREDVQKELEMLQGQIDDIRELSEDRRGGTRDMFSGLQDIEDPDERMAKARELREKAAADLEAEIAKILLPHQLTRARQLAYQQRLRGGTGRALTGGGSLVEELGITESQLEKLRAVNEELQEELRQKIAELQEDAEKELLKVLTFQQQAKLKKLVGEPFEFQQGEGGVGGRGGQGQGGVQGRGGRTQGDAGGRGGRRQGNAGGGGGRAQARP